jgi:Uncharacterized protein conserved in bacteria
MNNDKHTELLAPFEDKDIEWRLQWINDEKTSGKAVPYVTNRAIQYRLDTVVGFGNWKNEYTPWHSDGKKASQICGISIYFEDRKEWVTKYDGAEDSDIEPVKGGLSDSMKRAAVQWGIGRYLYGMDTVFVNVETRGRTTYIVKSEYAKLNRVHQEHVLMTFGEQPKKTAAKITEHKAAEPPTQKHQPTGPREVPKASPPPSNCVWVDKVAIVPSPAGKNNMNLKLRDVNGNTVEAFLQGENPEISPGVALVKTKFSKKENKGVLFRILESYEIADSAA